MRNHWLKLHEQKKRRFWTSEFSKNGLFILKPRRVEVIDSYSLGLLGSTSGSIELNYKGMMSNGDAEFIDFLTEMRKSMRGWLARLRFYSGLLNELEYYELTDLKHISIGMGNSIEDIRVEFSYGNLRNVQCV